MAKSSFIGSLAKGFVRSAVNQVGRDSGKVVSNSVYGDRHSTPVRRVNGTTNPASGTGQTNGVNTDVIERQSVEVGTFALIIYIIAGFIFPVIGPGLLIINGVKRLTRQKVTIKRLVSEEIFIPDETSSTGQRHAGHQEYIKKEKVPSTEHDIHEDRKIGTIYLIAGILALLFHIILYYGEANADVIAPAEVIEEVTEDSIL